MKFVVFPVLLLHMVSFDPATIMCVRKVRYHSIVLISATETLKITELVNFLKEY